MEEYKRRLKRQNVLLWIALVLVIVLDVLIGEFWDELGFLHSYQIPCGLSRRIFALCQIDPCAGNQQFPASPGVFYMNRFFRQLPFMLYFDLRDKSIGPA